MKKSVIFCFIEGNPPTVDHLKFVNAMINSAKQKKADLFIFISSEDSNQNINPIGFYDRINYFRKVFPFIYIYEKEIKNYIEILLYLYYKKYDEIILATWVQNNPDLESLKNYVKTVPELKKITFSTLPLVSLNPDQSPSKDLLMNSVIDNNFSQFKQVAMGSDEGDFAFLYRLIKKNLGIQESTFKKFFSLYKNL